MLSYVFLTIAFLGLIVAQTPSNASEVHPSLTTWTCTKAGGCKRQNTFVVLDSGAHSIHQKNNVSKSCGSWGSPPDHTLCPDQKTCAENCVIEGISNYADFGVTTNGGSLELNMYNSQGSLVSPRVYLLDENQKDYEMLHLNGNELAFDVDVSKLPCGMNGALYLSEMEADGGRSSLNPAGSSYGTGYCDAQCFVTPFIDGVGNINSSGVCCNEMDVWEANDCATQLSAHVCGKNGLFPCTGNDCGSTGLCDKIGCGDNPYKAPRDDHSFYGTGLKVDTTKPFTVVTQFLAQNGTLQSIVRKYVQGGVVIDNANKNITMNQAFCSGADNYNRLGGHKTTGDSLARGMVLAMSIWWDDSGFVNWLDTGAAGPCNTTEGDPKVIVQAEKNPVVKFSQIKWGEIGSTFAQGKGYSK